MQPSNTSRNEPAQVIDPVCGMAIDLASAAGSLEWEHEHFYFCSPACLSRFRQNPQNYLGARPVRAEPAAAKYTCPMHPEIVRDAPGSCPICGMALEPVVASVEPGPNLELRDMSRRFGVGAVLSLPLVVLAMGSHVPALDRVPARVSGWIQLLLSTPVVLWAGWSFFTRAWRSVVTLRLNMFTLIAMGTGMAWLFSLVATLAPQVFPAAFRSADGSVGLYFEAAAVITVLVLLGQVLELRARERTGSAVRRLLELAPRTARRVGKEGDEEVPIDAIRPGDRVRVRPGEKVPVDGVIREGKSTIDESMVTGESMPVVKEAGAAVTGGTMNRTGGLVIEAEKVGADTLLARIVRTVAEAQRSRAPIQRLADRVSAWFVPAVLLAAFVAFVAWALFGPPPPLAYGLVAAVATLIIACPCALGLATPMAVVTGVGRGARAGVLFRSAESLERLEAVDTVIFDKTGTLTEGRPRVTAVHVSKGFDVDEVLRLAAGVERASEHPLGLAVVAEASARGLAVPEVGKFESVSGRGARGVVGGRAVLVGNAAFLESAGAAPEALKEEADRLRSGGGSVIFVAIDGASAGLIAVADPVKATAKPALEALRSLGLRRVMVTGDNRTTAEAIARQLGIDEVESEVMPEDKSRIVRRLQGEGRVVAMAGDGVNDAPALAAADVGIAMGTGTDVAIDSAGVTLLQGDLFGLVRALALSRATMRNIRQNLVFAFLYNALGVPIAAGALYPSFGILMNPMFAALAMSLSSVSVIVNSLRLRTVRLEGPSLRTAPSGIQA